MQKTISPVFQTASPSMAWLGILLLGGVLAGSTLEVKAAPSESILQLELKTSAEEEGAQRGGQETQKAQEKGLVEDVQVKEAKSIPEPSFAAAFAAGTGILLTVNYWRRRFGR